MSRFATWTGLAMLVLLSAAGPACAASARGASDGTSTRAQAALDFRIVIPETVRLGPTQDPPGHARTFTSRTTEVHGDRVVVTIAKP